MEELLYPGGPPFFFLILISLEGNRSRTRKGIQFWLERLTINSAGNSILVGLGFITTLLLVALEGARAALNWELPSTIFIKIYRGIAVT